jgi:hypothetical protein
MISRFKYAKPGDNQPALTRNEVDQNACRCNGADGSIGLNARVGKSRNFLAERAIDPAFNCPYPRHTD